MRIDKRKDKKMSNRKAEKYSRGKWSPIEIKKIKEKMIIRMIDEDDTIDPETAKGIKVTRDAKENEHGEWAFEADFTPQVKDEQ